MGDEQCGGGEGDDWETQIGRIEASVGRLLRHVVPAQQHQHGGGDQPPDRQSLNRQPPDPRQQHDRRKGHGQDQRPEQGRLGRGPGQGVMRGAAAIQGVEQQSLNQPDAQSRERQPLRPAQ
ncbi:hypothetical protein D3C87_1522920 [compost metagenome]